MQATKSGNDYRFWSDSIQYWQEKAQAYLSMGMEQDFKRCLDRADEFGQTVEGPCLGTMRR